MPSMPLRRKKWTEEEEQGLISKYGELLQSGFLSKLKTRKRKFEPIVNYVNALFHARNPGTYPWPWTWKDASIKVQNMRHQYLLVKQKIRRIVGSLETGQQEEFDWDEGLTHWPNFLKYKEVFGDQQLDANEFWIQANPRRSAGKSRPRLPVTQGMQSIPKGLIGVAGNGGLLNENGVLLVEARKEAELEAGTSVHQVVLDTETGGLGHGLGFEYGGESNENGIKDGLVGFDDEDDEAVEYGRRKKRTHWRSPAMGSENNTIESRILAFIASQFAELREREAIKEEQELERERERRSRELQMDAERAKQEVEWKRDRWELEQLRQRQAEIRDLGKGEQELKREMMEHERREVEKETQRAWEQKMEQDKMEWREKMETQTFQHQAAMMQIQLQIAQNQQNTVTMLTGLLLQLAGQGNDLPGQGSSISPYVSQLLQNLQLQGNGMAHCGIRKGGGESGDSPFDVDG